MINRKFPNFPAGSLERSIQNTVSESEPGQLSTFRFLISQIDNDLVTPSLQPQSLASTRTLIRFKFHKTSSDKKPIKSTTTCR